MILLHQDNCQIEILPFVQKNISQLVDEFARHHWPKPESTFELYWNEQTQNERLVWIAYYNEQLAGYITLKKTSYYQPFQDNHIPEIMDLNVLPPYRNKGIGSLLLDIAEQEASKLGSHIIGLGVGLYKDYGHAQKLYVKRGYIPDGLGVTYDYKPVKPGSSQPVDDDLVLWFTKKLIKKPADSIQAHLKNDVIQQPNITDDPILSELVHELTVQYNCHTIILYGSRAGGQATQASDYDLAGISKTGTKNRIARFDRQHQAFIDLFVYPEADLISLQEEHLCMHDGIVLKEEGGFGVRLLNEINKIVSEPPELAEYELNLRRVWYKKMLARAHRRDIDGLYRHFWALYTLIEDYFAFRNLRYLGPKKAFEYLKEHDMTFLEKYEFALQNPNDLNALELIIRVVLNE